MTRDLHARILIDGETIDLHPGWAPALAHEVNILHIRGPFWDREQATEALSAKVAVKHLVRHHWAPWRGKSWLRTETRLAPLPPKPIPAWVYRLAMGALAFVCGVVAWNAAATP